MIKALLIIYVYCQTKPEWAEPEYVYSIDGEIIGPFDGLGTIASRIQSMLKKTGERADIICKPPTDMYVVYGKSPLNHEPLSREEKAILFEELHWK